MNRRTAGYAVLILTLVFALAPAYRGEVEMTVRVHHLLHALMLIGAGISGYLIAARNIAAPASGRGGWLVLSVIAPMVSMLLMWPSEYSPLEKLPFQHVIEHLLLVGFGFLTAYAGQVYASGVGVAMTLSMWTMAFLAVWGFGISPPLQVSNASAATAGPSQSSASGAPNAAHGAAVYAANCSSCHGAKGAGGMGPSLRSESARKNMQQAIAWIENPQPPMPKLYPSAISEQDVRDVAAYVESLK